MSEEIIVLPSYYAERIIACGRPSGLIEIKQDAAERLYIVDGFTRGQDQGGHHGGSRWVEGHYLSHASRDPRGMWYRVDPIIHLAGFEGAVKSASLPLDTFKDAVDGGWIGLNRDAPSLAVTYAELPDGGVDWQAWILSEPQNSAQLIPLELIAEDTRLLAPLDGYWPLDELGRTHVVVVGAGSVGSSANDALAAYGVGHLTIVDPDRLLSHNFARHRAHPRDLGRRKVNAERDRLTDRDPCLDVTALALDVIYDADIMRPLFADADAVLVAADGVDPRRAANHLTRRAGTPAVFACVLGDGAYGEIVRSRAPHGCLLCARADLREAGGIAPETTLDRGYGDGTRHLPMTAVGADLALVGQVAARTTVATILEATGHRDQRLPGDQAVMSLRPHPGLAAPFDIDTALEIRWRPPVAARPDCPTCSLA